MIEALWGILGLGGMGVVLYLFLAVRAAGQDRQKAKDAKEEIFQAIEVAHAAKESAQDWANAPVTASDTANKLRARAEAKARRQHPARNKRSG